MKPGDLYQFKMTKSIYDADHGQMVGKPFVIVSIYDGCWVDILVDGRLDTGWGQGFLLEHTEAVNEVG